jgi:hypothetical protein
VIDRHGKSRIAPDDRHPSQPPEHLGPDGIIIDEHDNIWIACNQSDEVMVLEPTQGRLIAHRVSLVEQPRLSRRRRAGHRPLGRHQRYVVQKSADR